MFVGLRCADVMGMMKSYVSHDVSSLQRLLQELRLDSAFKHAHTIRAKKFTGRDAWWWIILWDVLCSRARDWWSSTSWHQCQSGVSITTGILTEGSSFFCSVRSIMKRNSSTLLFQKRISPFQIRIFASSVRTAASHSPNGIHDCPLLVHSG